MFCCWQGWRRGWTKRCWFFSFFLFVCTLGLCKVLGLFLLLPLCCLAVCITVFPCNFFILTPPHLFPGLCFVFLSPIPTSCVAKGISWHKRALVEYIWFSHFDDQSVGDGSCCSTKCPVSSRPPLCLKRKMRLWREDVHKIDS